jgi:hypothetical protein
MIAWSVVMMKRLLQHSADCAFSFVSDLLYIQCCSSVVVIRVQFYSFVQRLKIACIYVLFVLIDSERPSVFSCTITDSPLCPFVCVFILLFCVKVLRLLFHVLYFTPTLFTFPYCSSYRVFFIYEVGFILFSYFH